MSAVGLAPQFPEKRRNFYEVYYLKAHHLKSQTAIWLRYTFHLPKNALSPKASLWAIFFDARDPKKNLALKNDFPMERVRTEPKRPRIFVGDQMLGVESLKGKVQEGPKEISWNFDFNPNEESFCLLPSLAYKLPSPTRVITPDYNIYLYGILKVNGQEFSFDGEPAQLSHIWGSKHADQWGWAHSNAFQGKKETWMELLTVRPHFKIGKSSLSLAFFEYQGKRYRYNTPVDILRNKMEAAPGKLTFTCSDGLVCFKGEVTAPPEQIVGVTYEDPDGQHLYCYNSTVASAQVEFFLKGKRGLEKVDTLVSQHGAALEFGTRVKISQLPLYL